MNATVAEKKKKVQNGKYPKVMYVMNYNWFPFGMQLNIKTEREKDEKNTVT